MAIKQSSIANRIRTVILTTCVIVLLATAAAFVAFDVHSFKNQLVRHLSTIATIVADNLAAPLAFVNEGNAEEILDALRAENNIVAAILYDDKGNIFSTFPTNIASHLLPARVELGTTFEGKDVIVVKPVTHNSQAVGALYLRTSLNELYQRLWRYLGIVATVLFGSLVVAFILSSLLQKRISEPILALSRAAELVAEHEDYSVRAPKMTDDELGVLTDNFNRMLEETQGHQKRLTEQARLLDLSNDGIIVREADGKIVYWNRGAEEIYGWNKNEAIGKIKEQLLNTEYVTPKEEILQCLHRDGRWQGELIQTRRDGRPIYVITRWALDRDGRSTNILTSENDITERKKAEQTSRENEELFRAMGDNIAQLAWMTDPSGYIVWYNKRWYDYTGTTFEEVQGWGWKKVHHPDHLQRVINKWTEHLEVGKTWEDTFPILGRDGQFRWFLSRAFPIKDPQGNVVRWFGTNTDITEQKLSEEELERLVSERTARLQETVGELEAFSYSISHDMRAPLRAMQGYAKALQEDYTKTLDATALRYLERIQRSSNRLDLLIQDVLAYSRVAKGDIGLHKVDLEPLVEDIISAHPEFQSPLADITIEKPLPLIRGHEAYLTQCISNLLGNAVRFAREGEIPRVRIRGELLGEKVRLWVEDDGIGIDPSHFERIFQIFGQVYSDKKYGGTGIGLAIVRKAVQRMNGEVGVESELNKGSRFWILLDKA